MENKTQEANIHNGVNSNTLLVVMINKYICTESSHKVRVVVVRLPRLMEEHGVTPIF